jgi:hypothetical protein
MGTRTLTLYIALFVWGFYCGGSEPAFANGRTGKLKNYAGSIELSDGRCRVSVTLDPDIYVLVTLKDKYRVVRLRVVNDSSAALNLAGAKDRVEVDFSDGSTTAAVLDLGKVDSAAWDSLSKEIRARVVYPKLVEGHGEEQSIFLFIPVGSGPPVMPRSFRYLVASVPGRRIDIMSSDAAAKK